MSEETKKNDGGPAFPADNTANVNDTMGMSLRDWFAGQAMAGLVNSDVPSDAMLALPDESIDYAHYIVSKVVAKLAYLMSDAMLAERDK